MDFFIPLAQHHVTSIQHSTPDVVDTHSRVGLALRLTFA
jgi:hypothetical protein